MGKGAINVPTKRKVGEFVQIFVYSFVAVIIIVGFSSTLVSKRKPTLYWLPGTILSVITLAFAIISFFTLNGWDAMGFFFLFISVLFGSVIGTFIVKFKKASIH
ncbi:YesK family protein [Cytobacillus sp. IB215665]|uniref:YesK family protein n=1 Tax=Cytobacillus sp. IB215665 TaxID=3097357 RepID=UPI002A10F49B|nr:YesK family protein [Cytobacillus sp. IB215665]MDX8367101.1 YesK family protein [Cytobacillus sp. IB215665]